MRLLTSFALLVCLASIASAADWPQWLGPNRDGTVPEKIAPWKGDLKRLWDVDVGEGNASPIVVGDFVFLHSKVKDKDEERLQAFDRKSGKVAWEKDYPKAAFKPFFGEGPRATPCVHNGKIYTLGNTGTLACWDVADGKQNWLIETLADAKKDNLTFGISASPLIVGDNVVVQGGGKGSKGVKAYECKTGKLAWTAGADAASYAAPVLFGKEIVVLTGEHLASITADGSIRWTYPFKDALNESSTTPIKVNDTYIAASVTAGAVALRETDTGAKGKKLELAWSNKALNCYFSTPVPVDDKHLYLVTGGLSINPAVTLRCVETATGKEIWKKANVGKYHAALLKLADGKLLMHDDASGNLRLLAPNVKEYEELATSKACGSTWAHPAIADGKIYVRDGKELICLSLSGE